MKGHKHDDAEGSIQSPLYRNPLFGRLQRHHCKPRAGPGHLIGHGLLCFNQRTDESNQSMLGHSERHWQFQPGRHLGRDLRDNHELRPLYCAGFDARIRF
jgi:hypothetical protein